MSGDSFSERLRLRKEAAQKVREAVTEIDLSPLNLALTEAEGLPAEAALERLRAALAGLPEVLPKYSDPWLLSQELHFQVARMCHQSNDLQGCLTALRRCDWREADELEVRAVQQSQGTQWSVVALAEGGYRVERSVDEVLVTRHLSPDLKVLDEFSLPHAAYGEFESAGFSLGSGRAERLARAAFHCHSAGRSEMALGLLELAVAACPGHGLAEGSRQALLAKGFQPFPRAQALWDLYHRTRMAGRSTPRRTPDQAQHARLEELRENLALDNFERLTPESPAGLYLLECPMADLLELVSENRPVKVLAFLSKHSRKRAKAVEARYPPVKERIEEISRALHDDPRQARKRLAQTVEYASFRKRLTQGELDALQAGLEKLPDADRLREELAELAEDCGLTFARDPQRVAVRERAAAAFAALEAEGIFAEGAFSCCVTCALAELDDVLTDSPQLLGCAYWHDQDELRLWSSGTLTVRFLVNPKHHEDEDAGMRAIGQKVCDALRQQNLDVLWDGQPESVIEVHN